MPETLEVRRIRPEEYDEVGEITVAAYEPFLLGPEDFYIERLRNTAIRDEQAEVWVALHEGQIAGSVTLCPPDSLWREIARPGEGEFRMLGVSPTHQGRGVGRALTRLVINRCSSEGDTAIALSSLDRMTAAHRLYESLGFVRAPERDWQPQPAVSLIVYRRELP